MLVDSHAHLDFPTSSSLTRLRGTGVDDLPEALQRAQSEGVGKIVTIGTSIESSKKAIEIAESYTSYDLKIYATVGIHPQDGKDEIEKSGLYQCINTLKQVAQSDRVIGIGECGLDYYLAGEKRIETVNKDRKFQRELFKAQINLAAELNLPLVVHCRNGWDKIFSLLTTDYRLRTRLRGVFHSWTGNWQAAKKALNLGFYISFSGIVTYKNAPEIQEVAKKMPLEQMLVETDSPFLTPRPPSAGAEGAAGRAEYLRGEKNEPKNVKIIAEFLAQLRNLPLDEITEQTAQNAQSLFKL